MSLSHDRAPETTPPAPAASVGQALQARPNLGAADYPIAQGGGAEAAGAALAADPLAAFYYEALVQDPVANLRDALFTCYLHDWPGFDQMLAAVDSAARAELHATDDPDRATALRGLRPGFAAGKAALRSEPSPFELDILLGLLDPTTAHRTAAFITEVYASAAAPLCLRLRERAGDDSQRERALYLMSLLNLDHADPAQATQPDPSGAWDSAVDWAADGAGGLVDVSVDALADTPVLGPLATTVAPGMKFGQQLTGGLAKGAGAMVGGFADMALHPLQTAAACWKMLEHIPLSPLKPLGKLYDIAAGNKTLEDTFLRSPLDAQLEELHGDRVFWAQLADAAIDPIRRPLAQGKTGEAIGRGIFEVGSMFFGAGELGALGKGTKLAGEAAPLRALGAVGDDGARLGAKASAKLPKNAHAPATKPTRLSAAAEADFHKALGEARTARLLARYGADAIEHYGPEFFATLKGITDQTMDHMLSVARVARGQIVGCHDEAAFLEALVQQGNGAVVRTTSAADPNVVKIEYSLYQRDRTGQVIQPHTLQVRDPEAKTVLRDLSTDTAGWRARFSQILDQAIHEKAVPPDGGRFEITVRGVPWQGYLRDGVVHTLFPLI